MINLRPTNVRIIQDQTLAFAYEQYQSLRSYDAVGKDRFESAIRIAELFQIDAAFLIYADEFGLETALEYFRNVEGVQRNAERSRFMELFESESKEDSITGG